MREYRRIRENDREEIHELLVGTRAFQKHEVEVALELIDIALTKPEQQDYHPYVLLDTGMLVAYACFGRNPMTRATYDLYWIATKAGQTRKGYGRELFAFVEQDVKARGGRLLMVETSSKEQHRGSHAFYVGIGCELAARLPDFYDEGDDMLIYSKRLR